MAKTKTELAKLPFLIEAAEANCKYVLSSKQGKQSAKGAISDNVIAKSENDHAVATANLRELELRKPNLEQEVSALQDVVTVLEHQLQLLVEETRQLGKSGSKGTSGKLNDDPRPISVQDEPVLDNLGDFLPEPLDFVFDKPFSATSAIRRVAARTKTAGTSTQLFVFSFPSRFLLQ